MQPSFLLATPSDVDRLIPLMREYYAFDHIAFHEVNARATMHELVNSPHLGKVYTIMLNNELAGYAVLVFVHSLEFHGRAAFIDELYIREISRGQGIGKSVLEFLFAECHAAGIRALRLEVTQSNSVAKNVYAKMGFEMHDRNIMTKKI